MEETSAMASMMRLKDIPANSAEGLLAAGGAKAVGEYIVAHPDSARRLQEELKHTQLLGRPPV